MMQKAKTKKDKIDESPMILYHGSQAVVEKPQYGLGRKDNDFGQGFYLTEEPELAKEWAAIDETGGFLNRYSLESEKLTIMDLTSGEYHVLEWLALLIQNRSPRLGSMVEKRGKEYLTKHFLPDYLGKDVLIGFRADDSFFSFARAFLSNTITVEQLERTMMFGELGKQVVLKSRRAFEKIRFLETSPVNGTVYYPRRRERDANARGAFECVLKENAAGIYLNEIMQKGLKKDDLCIS